MFRVHLDAQCQKNGSLALSYYLEEMNKNSRFYHLQYFAKQIKSFRLDFSARRKNKRIARNKEQRLIWSYIDCPATFGIMVCPVGRQEAETSRTRIVSYSRVDPSFACIRDIEIVNSVGNNNIFDQRNILRNDSVWHSQFLFYISRKMLMPMT